MGYESINYICGHVGRVQMYGKMSERDRRVAAMERGLCPECEKTELAKQNAAKAAENAAAGLPALVGSEKQISWAETIRAKILKTDWHEEFKAFVYGLPVEKHASVNARIQDWIDAEKSIASALAKKTDAKFWIDHRFYVSRIVRDYCKSLGLID